MKKEMTSDTSDNLSPLTSIDLSLTLHVAYNKVHQVYKMTDARGNFTEIPS